MAKVTLVRMPPPRRLRTGIKKIQVFNADEGLTGWVNGEKASDLEERVARSLRRFDVEFQFRVPFATAHSLRGEEKEIDFIVSLNGRLRAWEVDGNAGHRLHSSKERDKLREVILNGVLRKRGIKPIERLVQRELLTQEMADRKVRRLL